MPGGTDVIRIHMTASMPTPDRKMPSLLARRLLQASALAAAIVGLPLIGARLAGLPLERFLVFPPRPTPDTPGAVDASWVIAMALAALAVLAPFVLRVVRTPAATRSTSAGELPVWGWLGLAIVAVSWALAWSRSPWLGPWQSHTFTPLWIGYILVVNAWCQRRCGACPLTSRPWRYLALSPLSAAVWWGYEYLNLFAGNWYYVGGQTEAAWGYALGASVPFATVLPAVLATAHLLASVPRLSAGLESAWRWPFVRHPGWAWLMLAGGGLALLALPSWPNTLYPVMWLAPLMLLLGLQGIAGGHSPIAGVAVGDWRRPWVLATAGLVCGLFWELWNAGSLAHWEYVIPKVHALALFEMPLLGYLGYLPFGLTCGAMAELIAGPRRPLSPFAETH